MGEAATEGLGLASGVRIDVDVRPFRVQGGGHRRNHRQSIREKKATQRTRALEMHTDPMESSPGN